MLNVLIQISEPTVVPPVLLDLCTVTILHRFSSPSWWEHLIRHVSADFHDTKAFDQVVQLQVKSNRYSMISQLLLSITRIAFAISLDRTSDYIGAVRTWCLCWSRFYKCRSRLWQHNFLSFPVSWRRGQFWPSIFGHEDSQACYFRWGGFYLGT